MISNYFSLIRGVCKVIGNCLDSQSRREWMVSLSYLSFYLFPQKPSLATWITTHAVMGVGLTVMDTGNRQIDSRVQVFFYERSLACNSPRGSLAATAHLLSVLMLTCMHRPPSPSLFSQQFIVFPFCVSDWVHFPWVSVMGFEAQKVCG